MRMRGARKANIAAVEAKFQQQRERKQPIKRAIHLQSGMEARASRGGGKREGLPLEAGLSCGYRAQPVAP